MMPGAPLQAGPALGADDLRLLARVGLLALQEGRATAARAIFRELVLLSPCKALPYIGTALAHVLDRDFDAAVEVLREGLKRTVAEDGAIRAFLGLALLDGGHLAEGTAVLKAVLDTVPFDEPAARLAARTLAARGDEQKGQRNEHDRGTYGGFRAWAGALV